MRRSIAARPNYELAPLPGLPWDNPAAFRGAVEANFTALRAASEKWCVIWAAGVANMASSAEQISQELEQFRLVLQVLAKSLGTQPHNGIFFLASSVGAVYAGSENPPFTESTRICATSPYGELKVSMERSSTEFALASRTPIVIGRITNLYGPGQRVDKMQGLITHLILSRFGKVPMSIFVPLDTVRDYFYVDDCAELILDSLNRLTLHGESTATAVVKILGSGEATSISALLGHLRFITKVPPAIALGWRESSAYQAADLRVRSIVWPDIDRRAKMPLAAGFHSTILDVLKLIQR